jgi:hypothetical protein
MRRWIIVGLVVAGLAGMVAAFSLADTDDSDDSVLSETGPVERLIPGRESEILRQEPVGIDLNPGWTGVIVLNGVEIPEDQLIPGREALGELLYQVGEGKAVERFRGGRNCITAVVWRVEQSRSEGRDIDWCFEVT